MEERRQTLESANRRCTIILSADALNNLGNCAIFHGAAQSVAGLQVSAERRGLPPPWGLDLVLTTSIVGYKQSSAHQPQGSGVGSDGGSL